MSDEPEKRELKSLEIPIRIRINKESSEKAEAAIKEFEEKLQALRLKQVDTKELELFEKQARATIKTIHEFETTLQGLAESTGQMVASLKQFGIAVTIGEDGTSEEARLELPVDYRPSQDEQC